MKEKEGIKYDRIREAQGGGESDELREFAAERLIRFIETNDIKLPGDKTLREVLNNRESTQKYILSLTHSDYVRLLIGINAMVRNKTGRDTWEMDGEGVRMSDENIFPEQKDKEALLAKSLEAAKAMAQEGRSTEDISIQLAVPLTAIHPFANGNGRTAKFLFTLLNAGYDPRLLKDVLTSTGFSNAVNAVLFQSAAIETEDPTHELVQEKFDAWMEVPENRKKVVELIIDMIKNDRNPEYLDEGNISSLDTFKESVKETTDKNLYERIYRSGSAVRSGFG